MSEWGDPRAGDEVARERERRRAEREARRAEREERRRSTRGALGERVSGLSRADRPMRGGAVGPAPGPRSPVNRRRRLATLGALVAAVLVVVVAAVAIHRGSDGGGAPAAKPAAPAKKITIPEGYDRRQTAEVAAQAGVRGDYMKASERFKGFNPSRYGAQNPSSLEGFLFPATYDLPRHPTVDDLVVRQLDAFKQYTSGVSMGYARSKNLTTYDVLTIASMIEREVQVPKERKLVAAVIYNRRHAGMPLQIDATVRYATQNFTEPLTQSELQTDSPYNTYLSPGLPPGPIGNPGLASIEAAAHPAHVPFLYYVVKPGTCPAEHTFAATEAEFERAKAAYDKARAEAGGQSPTC